VLRFVYGRFNARFDFLDQLAEALALFRSDAPDHLHDRGESGFFARVPRAKFAQLTLERQRIMKRQTSRLVHISRAKARKALELLLERFARGFRPEFWVFLLIAFRHFHNPSRVI
jgi:aminoglycoside phosphotransferase family enzyme